MAIVLLCVPHLCIPATKNNKRWQHKRQHDGWDVNLWKYEQESKQAKARHGKPRQASQARQSQAKPGIEGKMSHIEALRNYNKSRMKAL